MLTRKRNPIQAAVLIRTLLQSFFLQTNQEMDWFQTEPASKAYIGAATVCLLLLWRKIFVMIGCGHYSDFCFTTVNLKMLYHLIYRKPCIGSLIIFNPNISVHFLHTVLYTFPIVLTKRICLTIKSFFSWWSIPLSSILMTSIFVLGLILIREISC